MTRHLSEDQFVEALSKLKIPGGLQVEFLLAHAQAKGRAMTMRRLAEEAGYSTWSGMNLRYGHLAKRIGQAAGISNPDITLLVEFVPPKGRSPENTSNVEWILVMDEHFASALKKVGWI